MNTADALCAQTDPNLWYPERGGDTGMKAKAICQRCPVIQACAQAALDGDERFGIWAGVAMYDPSLARPKLRAIAGAPS